MQMDDMMIMAAIYENNRNQSPDEDASTEDQRHTLLLCDWKWKAYNVKSGADCTNLYIAHNK